MAPARALPLRMAPLLAALLAFLSTACAPPRPLLRVDSLQAVREGDDASWCGDFQPPAKAVQTFFKKAAIIDWRQVHDAYERLPCRMEGKGLLGEEDVTWTVNAGFFGSIKHADGSETVFGCKGGCEKAVFPYLVQP